MATMRQFTLATTIITMYQLQHLTSVLVGSFTPPITFNSRATATTTTSLSSSSTIPSETITKAKQNVLDVSQRLFSESPTGVFIRTPSAIKELKKVVSELEAISPSPSSSAVSPKLMMGDWKLVVTTNYPTRKSPFGVERPEEIKKSPIDILPDPFDIKSKIEETRNKLRESVEVIQRIRSFDWNEDDDDDTTTYLAGSGLLANDEKFNRIDNVISFTPFSFDFTTTTTTTTTSSSPNLNPLEVSNSKVTLAHKASIQSITPVLRTKISLKSIILTVAGTSQYLEPEGADVLSLNVLALNEFTNAGTFDTTYVDENVRVSRGTVGGVVEQLRVFVRKEDGSDEEEEEEEEVVGDIEAVGDVVVEEEKDEITVDDADDDDGNEVTNEVDSVDDEEIVDVAKEESSVDGDDDDDDGEQPLDSNDDEETRL